MDDRLCAGPARQTARVLCPTQSLRARIHCGSIGGTEVSNVRANAVTRPRGCSQVGCILLTPDSREAQSESRMHPTAPPPYCEPSQMHPHEGPVEPALRRFRGVKNVPLVKGGPMSLPK